MSWRNRETGEHKPFTCNCWSCPDCGPKVARYYRWRIGAWAEHYDLSRFLTITLDPSKALGTAWGKKLLQDMEALDLDPASAEGRAWWSWKYIKQAWNRFLTSLRRLHPGLQYICIMEPHKSGIFHMHALLNQYIHWTTIRKLWERAGGGRHVRIEKVRDIKKVRAYVSQYVTKIGDADPTHYPKGARRITTSRGIRIKYYPKNLNLEAGQDPREAPMPWEDCFPEHPEDCYSCRWRMECRTAPTRYELCLDGLPVNGPPRRLLLLQVKYKYRPKLCPWVTYHRKQQVQVDCQQLPPTCRPCTSCAYVYQCREAYSQPELPRAWIDHATGELALIERTPHAGGWRNGFRSTPGAEPLRWRFLPNPDQAGADSPRA